MGAGVDDGALDAAQRPRISVGVLGRVIGEDRLPEPASAQN
jgi:hypothetical protein